MAIWPRSVLTSAGITLTVNPMALKRAILTTSLAFLVVLAAAGTAGAQDNPDYTAPAPSIDITVPSGESPQNITRTPETRSTSITPLALTGSDVAQLVLMGGVLLACGAGVLVARRRTTA